MGSSDVRPLDLLIETIRKQVGLENLPESAAKGALLWVLEENPPPSDGHTVSPWLIRVLRKASEETRRRIGIPEKEEPVLTGMDTLVAEQSPFLLAHACIAGMLSELDDDQAMVLRQLELANVSPTQLAIKLSTSPNDVRVRAKQARAVLYQRMVEASRQR